MALGSDRVDALPGEVHLLLELDHPVYLPVHGIYDNDAEDAHGQEQQRAQKEAGKQLGVDGRPRPSHHVDKRSHPTDRERLRICFRHSLVDRVCHTPPASPLPQLDINQAYPVDNRGGDRTRLRAARRSFLTNHARVLLWIAHDAGVRLRDIATALGIPNAAPMPSSPTWPRAATW